MMGTTIVGVIRELSAGERRVSLTPEAVGRLHPNGFEVLVETGAGASAGFFDEEYEAAGAGLVSTAELYERADVLTCVDLPERRDGLRPGQLLIGLLNPLTRPEEMRELAGRGVTAVSLDMLPRKLSRAQTMDALSSQASIAGYKAAVLAADTYGRYFPMLTTAAGTTSPATVLVLGTGVAGLSAIGTARRLGAMVTAYDVRPEAKGEAESLGAKFLELTSVASASGEGGYARALTEDERDAQQLELASHIGRFNVVITTARVPGRTPPLLVTRKALEGMASGSVVVDMGASDLGGNVELSRPGEKLEVAGGVTVIGAANLASDMAPAASFAYARNLSALLNHLAPDGAPSIDTDDEIAAGVVVTRDGRIVHPALAEVSDES